MMYLWLSYKKNILNIIISFYILTSLSRIRISQRYGSGKMSRIPNTARSSEFGLNIGIFIAKKLYYI